MGGQIGEKKIRELNLKNIILRRPKAQFFKNLSL